MRSLISGVLAGILALAVSGCGGKDKPVPVNGIVKLDGQPLAGATVTFSPAGNAGQPASGRTADDGTFHLSALPGDYKVVVTLAEALDLPGGEPPAPKDIDKFMRGKTGKMRAERKKPKPSVVPTMYTKEATTPLRLKVPPDSEVTLALSSK